MILALVTLATAFLEPQSSGDNLFLSHQGSLWSCPLVTQEMPVDFVLCQDLLGGEPDESKTH
jgi:hypothetical protein